MVFSFRYFGIIVNNSIYNLVKLFKNKTYIYSDRFFLRATQTSRKAK